MATKYKESKDNPFHKEFGWWSNTVYIVKKCKQYCPVVLWFALLKVFCASTSSYYLSFCSKFVIDSIGSDLNFHDKSVRLVIIVITAAIVGGLLQWGETLAASKTWPRYIFVRMGVIEERVERALTINYEFLEKAETLDIQERASQAVGGNGNGVEGMMHTAETLATRLTSVLVTVISVMVLDIRLVVVLAALAVIQFIYFQYCVRACKKNVWDKLGNTWRQMNYMERVTQDFDYAKDIRLFSMKDFLFAKQEKVYESRWEKFDYNTWKWFSHSVVVELTFLIAKAAVYGTLLAAVINKDMSVGNFTMFFSLALAFSTNLVEFLRRVGDYNRQSLEVDDFRSFMELKFDDEGETVDIPIEEGYKIEFKNVSYKYPEAEEYALKNLNLSIDKSERLAVVGLNGAGKTTMIKLLLRLYEPTEGEILLNGVNIKNYKREDYYKLFSPVFQDIEVLAFPIAENISMKSTENTDVDKAYECVVEAGLKEKVDGLKKGVLTELLKVVDDEGVDFSGGEKQKLALARALYKGAPIVVLDEPTSALDAIAEQHLYESFDKMIGEKSAVYISHRLASTRFCDHVAMFKSGEMVEYGSHDELMRMNGEYANMFELQAQYYQKGETENE